VLSPQCSCLLSTYPVRSHCPYGLLSLLSPLPRPPAPSPLLTLFHSPLTPALSAHSGLNGSWDTPGTGMNFLVHNMVSLGQEGTKLGSDLSKSDISGILGLYTGTSTVASRATCDTLSLEG